MPALRLAPADEMRSRPEKQNLRFPVIADGFDRTAFHRVDAQLQLFIVFGLLGDVGILVIVVAAEIVGRGFPARVAVNALCRV